MDGKNGKTLYFSEEQKKIIVETLLEKARNDPRRNKTEKRSAQRELTIEEMRELHPLVKDDRFFKTNYFPDVEIGENDD